MSKLFDDASLAMIPSAYKDGKLYSIRPIPEYGSETITNGGFDTDSNWTKETGWTISGGKATYNGSAAINALFQSASLVTGVTYRVRFDVVGYVGGTIRAYLSNGSTSGASPLVSSNGSYSFDIVATGPLCLFRNVTNFNGSIDNVSVQEIVGSGDFTFSRGSNLAATRVDVNGLIEKGRENTTTYSQDSSQWFDVKLGIVSSSNTDPFNGSSAVEYEVTSTTGAAYFYPISPSISSGQVVTGSVYIKNVDQRYIQLLFGSTAFGNGHYQNFDLQTGTKGTSANIIDSSIESVGNGWYRLSITKQATANGSSGLVCGFVPSSSATRLQAPSTLGLSLQAFGFQTELGLVATDYIETGASTAQAGILEDMPRLDYSGGASCPALLLEPQRTNIFEQSEYFSGSYWAKTGTGGGNAPVVTQNYAVSPEGLNNASRVQFDTNGSTSNHRSGLVRDFAFTTGDKYAISCWVKSASGSDEIFTFRIAGAQVGGEKTATNEWQLFTETHTATATTTDNFGMQIRGNYSSQTSDILIYGMQLESDVSYPTSYIPTYGSSVTRSDEVCKLLSSPAIVDQDNCTAFIEYEYGNSTGGSGTTILGIHDGGSIANRIQIVNRNSEVVLFSSASGTIIINSAGLISSLSKGDIIKIALVINTEGIIAFCNGTKVYTLSTSPVWSATMDDLFVGSRSGVGEFGSGEGVKQVAMYPTALTDSECIALTTL